MSNTKMSGEFEKWWDERRPRFSEIRVIAESAWDAAQAAAIGEREELVEALRKSIDPSCVDFGDGRFMYSHEEDKHIIDILVRHGRVIRDGDTYKWSDRR